MTWKSENNARQKRVAQMAAHEAEIAEASAMAFAVDRALDDLAVFVAHLSRRQLTVGQRRSLSVIGRELARLSSTSSPAWGRKRVAAPSSTRSRSRAA